MWPTKLILNRPGADVASGLADVLSVGTMTLANPDFVRRGCATATSSTRPTRARSTAAMRGATPTIHTLLRFVFYFMGSEPLWTLWSAVPLPLAAQRRR